MNDLDLQVLVEEVSIQYFSKPFLHKATFNRRLRTTGGRYLLRTHNIEINEKYFIEYGLEEVIGIVKHELCHYHLHLEGKGYQHRDQDFRDLLQKVNAPRFCTPLKTIERKKSSETHLYECKSCCQRYIRKRKIDVNRYVCGKCSGKLKYLT
ncbi:SprT family protein [Bacillus timonensis]|nr:SprT family protein [Bacillus timonensis]